MLPQGPARWDTDRRQGKESANCGLLDHPASVEVPLLNSRHHVTAMRIGSLPMFGLMGSQQVCWLTHRSTT